MVNIGALTRYRIQRISKLFLLIAVILSNPDISNSQPIKLKNKGQIDVIYKYGDPSPYYPEAKKNCIEMSSKLHFNGSYYKDDIPSGLRNLSSAILRIRFWTILGDPISNPEFVYSLNKESLTGEKHGVNYVEISKYPDLKKRYHAIRPVSVNAIIGMGLNPDEPSERGDYIFFCVRDNDLIITEQEKRPLSVPTSASWGELVLPLNFSQNEYTKPRSCIDCFPDFQDFKQSNSEGERIFKALKKTTNVDDKAWVKVRGEDEFIKVGNVNSNGKPINTYIVIKWPVKEIDNIYETYLKYESGELKSPVEEVEEEISKRNLQAYSGKDEWALPFEDETGNVTTFYDNTRKVCGLRNDKREIIVFNTKDYGSISPMEGSKYFKVHDLKSNGYFLVNSKGMFQTIDGVSIFDRIEFKDNEFSFYKYLTPTTLLVYDINDLRYEPGDKSKFFDSEASVRQSLEDFKRWVESKEKIRIASLQNSSSGGLQIAIIRDWGYRKVKVITANKSMELKESKTGYQLFSEVS